MLSEICDGQRLEAFTRNSVKVDASRGGTFVLFNGNVTGKFQELVGHTVEKDCLVYYAWFTIYGRLHVNYILTDLDYQ